MDDLGMFIEGQVVNTANGRKRKALLGDDVIHGLRTAFIPSHLFFVLHSPSPSPRWAVFPRN
jgi:hypothetical protein